MSIAKVAIYKIDTTNRGIHNLIKEIMKEYNKNLDEEDRPYRLVTVKSNLIESDFKLKCYIKEKKSIPSWAGFINDLNEKNMCSKTEHIHLCCLLSIVLRYMQLQVVRGIMLLKIISLQIMGWKFYPE